MHEYVKEDPSVLYTQTILTGSATDDFTKINPFGIWMTNGVVWAMLFPEILWIFYKFIISGGLYLFENTKQ